jgi:hypothetical protein
MATRYWVGGAGTWDATTTTNWSATSGGSGGASAPTSADNVIFNSASNATAYAVTIGTNAVCADVTIAGPASGNVTITSGATAVINVYGSWTSAATGVVFTSTTGSVINFLATTTGKTITTNNVTLGNLQVICGGTGGGWSLGSAFTSTTSFSITNGAFNTANFAMSIGSLAASTTSTRSVSLGSSAITCSTGTPINITTPTGLTFDAGTSTITGASTSPTFNGGGQTFYNVIFTSTANGVTTITGVNTFNNLTQTSLTTTGARRFVVAANQTINGTLTLGAANTPIRRIQVVGTASTGTGIGTPITLTVATIATLGDVDFRDMVAAGASGTWSGTRLGNAGGNSNITFAAGVNKYWNLAAGGNWSTTAWATTSGGTVAASNHPLAQDTVIIENTGLTTGNTITVDQNWFIGTIDASTRTTAFTLASSTNVPWVVGSYTIPSVATITGTGSWYFQGVNTTQTITTNGVSLTFPINCNGSPTNVVRIVGNLTTTNTVTLQQGTLNLNNYVLSATTFDSGTVANTLAFGTGNITVTGTGVVFTGNTNTTVTGTPQVICTDNSATARTISPGVVTEANSISFRITAGTGTFTITSTNAVRDLDFTDGVNPTGFAGAITNTTATVYGNLKCSTSGMVQNFTTSILTFAATSGTKTINTAGVVFDRPFNFNGAGATFQLQSNLILGPAPSAVASIRTCTLTAGTLDLNGYTLTAGLFNSSNSNTRVLAFGSGKIVVTGTNSTVYTTSTGTGLTFTGTPVVEIIGNGLSGETRSISGTNISTGAAFSNAANIYIKAGADTISLGTATRFIRTLDFTGFSGSIAANSAPQLYGDLVLSSTMGTISGTNTWIFASTTSQTITTNGITIDCAVTFDGVGGTFQLASDLTIGSTRQLGLSNGTLNLNSYTATAGNFSSNNSNTRTLAFGTGKIVITGNNATVFTTNTGTNLTITGSKRVEYNYSGSTGTRIVSGPLTATAVPGTNTCSHYITAGTDIFNPTGARAYDTIDCTGFGGTITSGNASIYGDLVLSSVSTFFTSVFSATFASTTAQTITSNGKTIDGDVAFDGSGSWTLQDDLTLGPTRTLGLTNGTLYLIYGNLTTGFFSSSNSNYRMLFNNGRTITCTGAGTAWNTNISSGLNVLGNGTISLTSASAKTFSGGNKNFMTINQGGAGTLTITGSNTFQDITNSYATTGATSVLFTAGTTTDFLQFSLAGSAGAVCTLGSTSASPALLRKPDYWYVGANSTDGGGNSRLIFTDGANVDYLAISNISGLAILSADAADSVSIGDYDTGYLSYSNSVFETAQPTDTPQVLVGFVSLIDETASSSEALGLLASFSPQVAESFQITDVSLVAPSVFGVRSAESTSALDALSVSAAFKSSTGDSVTITDAVARTKIRPVLAEGFVGTGAVLAASGTIDAGFITATVIP